MRPVPRGDERGVNQHEISSRNTSGACCVLANHCCQKVVACSLLDICRDAIAPVKTANNGQLKETFVTFCTRSISCSCFKLFYDILISFEVNRSKAFCILMRTL